MYRILVVEDDPLMQRTLKGSLGRAGFEVFLARDGESCLRELGAWKPDLVLLDVHLPDANGIELCRRIKAIPAFALIPVLLMTGEAMAVESRIGGLDAGGEDYLLKPFGPEELLARVRAVLRVSVKPARR